jgi:DNA-binding NarL/FixJ family response regulator
VNPRGRATWLLGPNERGRRSIRYLIIDDHRLFADAVQRTLERVGLTDAAVVTSPDEARRAVVETGPDLVLLAVTLAEGDGLDLGRELLELRPETKLVAMTQRPDSVLEDTAVRAGFRASLPKDTPSDEFVSCLRSVLDGEIVVGVGGSTDVDVADDPFAELTARERDVLSLLADGLPTAAIAERLTLSSRTVRSHIHRVLLKLGLESRLEAATYAARHGLGRNGDRMDQET